MEDENLSRDISGFEDELQQVSEATEQTDRYDRMESVMMAGRFFSFMLQFTHLVANEISYDDESYALYVRVLAWFRAVMALFAEFGPSLARQNTPRRFWMYQRGSGLDALLLHTYTDTDFRRRLRISKATFQYLCNELGPLMIRQDTKFRAAIPIETKIMMGLSRLATGDTLTGIADSYRVGFATAQQAVLEFVACVNYKLKELYIKWPSPNRMRSLAASFEAIHGIPYVIGAIDGSHIPIIAPHESAQEYYNRKGFHSILLQLIVSRDCLVWDFDIGWPGSIHDWTLFQRSSAGQRIMNGFIAPYCLVGDAAYPPRDYMLSPFKGHKDGLSREQYYWNYVQSSTRMPVECAFGRLKARFRILLKRNDMDLENVVQVVSACLVLHNLCIIHGDSFDETWAKEAKEELELSIAHEKQCVARMRGEKSSSGDASTSKRMEKVKYCEYGIYKVQGTSLSMEEAYTRTVEGENDGNFALQSHNITNVDATRRNAISKVLFEHKTNDLIQQKNVVAMDLLESSSSSSDSDL